MLVARMNRMKLGTRDKKLLICLTLLMVSACASQDPIVDKKGGNEEQYQLDLAECREYATQVNTAGAAAKQGAISAAVGGAIGAIVGDSRLAGQIAGVGAVSGSVKGAAKAEHRKDRVVNQCLRGRGYKVLG